MRHLNFSYELWVRPVNVRPKNRHGLLSCLINVFSYVCVSYGICYWELIGVQPLHNCITTPLTMVWGPCVWAPHHCEWGCDRVVGKGCGFSISVCYYLVMVGQSMHLPFPLGVSACSRSCGICQLVQQRIG